MYPMAGMLRDHNLSRNWISGSAIEEHSLRLATKYIRVCFDKAMVRYSCQDHLAIFFLV